MDEGKISSDMEPVKLSDIIDNCIESLRPIASKRNISLESSCDDCEILGNPTLIGEIIFNLIDNAVKYNKINGSVKVNIYKDGNKCILTVEDTGIGIEEGKQNQIFERFYRTDKSRSKDKGGTGLGLSIVKHAAEYHNAELDVKSELGKGTTMKVIFWCDPKNTSEQII
jgi:two-component system phosphate regulon sensor histidine kinase PhoR